MNNIMIDLETLGTSANSIFFSCGACKFNIETGEIGEKYYQTIDLQSSINAGRTFSASTLKWWFQQSDEARSKINDNGILLKDFLHEFSEFCGTESVVWGNGATFDISMLENAYGEYNQPWKFWNVRDVRTIVDLAHPKIEKTQVEFKGVNHNALDDAIYQAEYVSLMYKFLKNL